GSCPGGPPPGPAAPARRAPPRSTRGDRSAAAARASYGYYRPFRRPRPALTRLVLPTMLGWRTPPPHRRSWRRMSAPFGKYEIGREIGRGAVGIVYEARDPTLHRDVALKVAPVPEGASPEARQRVVERIRREGRALAALSHPNIVGILDMGEVEG